VKRERKRGEVSEGTGDASKEGGCKSRWRERREKNVQSRHLAAHFKEKPEGGRNKSRSVRVESSMKKTTSGRRKARRTCPAATIDFLPSS